jgi:diacylglycerol O-acyltransferase / wax synthase
VTNDVADRALSRRLAPLDAAFLAIETPEAPLHIGGVSIIDGDVRAAQLAARLTSRLDEIPRYLQRLVPAPLGIGHPAWEADPNFDIHQHIVQTELARPGGEAELQAHAARLFETLLSRDRPLWELHVIRRLAGRRTAILSKIHHCMVDGVSGVELMDVVYDLAPAGSPPRRGRVAAALPPASWLGLLVEGLSDAADDAVAAGVDALQALASLPATWRAVGQRAVEIATAIGKAASTPVSRLPFNRPLTGARRLSWLTWPLEGVMAVRRAHGGTVNDVVLAVLTDGVGRWLEATGFPVEGRYLRLLVPVNVREDDERGLLGNRVSMIPVEVPFEGDPLARLRAAASRSDAMKRAGIAEFASSLAAGGRLTPAWAQSWVLSLAASPRVLEWSAPFRSASFLVGNLVCTNVPGPPVPLYALGHRVRAHYPLVPLGFETGLNCAVFTYNQVLHVGFVADAGAIDDLQPLRDFVHDAYSDLCQAAGVTGAGRHRRRQKRHRGM